MKVIAFNGSPRKNGNTHAALELVLEEIRKEGIETELVEMGSVDIAPCKACGTCRKTRDEKCVNDKDKVNEWVQRIKSADGIIIGSPVYFGTVSAQTKAIMDRMFALLRQRALKDKIAGALVVTRRVGAIQARSLLYSFCIAQGMVVAGGAIGYGREPGDVLTGVGGGIDMSAMEEARLLGSNVVQLARRLERK